MILLIIFNIHVIMVELKKYKWFLLIVFLLKQKEDKMEEISLVTYTDDLYEFVYEMRKLAFYDYVEQCYGWNEGDQRQRYMDYIDRVKKIARIVRVNGENAGLLVAYPKDGRYFIETFCLMPEYRGKGIGTKVLQDEINAHADSDIDIQHFKSNPVSSLYERLGFQRVGETENHYQMVRPASRSKN